MLSEYDVDLLARLNREEMAREVTRVRRATSAQGRGNGGVWRRRLAVVLVALAAWLVPVTRPAGEVETEVRVVGS